MTGMSEILLQPADFRPHSLPLARRPPPRAGIVHLWYLDLARLGNPLDTETDLSAHPFTARQARALRRFYLRLLLGAYLGMPGKDVEISRLIKGKPVLAGPAADSGLEFSMSHSDGCVLIGICSSGAIGVDLEQAGRRAAEPLGLARRYFSAFEADVLATLDAGELDLAFIRTWALKEAVVKAMGHGIAGQLHRFSVSCQPGQTVRVHSMEDDDSKAWRLALAQPSGRHVAAVALRYPELRIEAFRLASPHSG